MHTHTFGRRRGRLRLRPSAPVALAAAVCLTATLATALTPALATTLAPGAAAAPAPGPDLTVKTVTVSDSAKPGDSIPVSVKVKNAGRSRAPATRTTFALSSDTSVGGDIALAARSKVKALKPGKSAGSRVTVVLPTSTPDGSYYVLACADAATKVRESAEKNNCRASKAAVKVTSAFTGRLSGTLTFVDRGTDVNTTAAWDTWDRTASATINMSVSGPYLREVFASTGSTYDITGTRDDSSTGPSCVYQRRRTETGGGTLAYTGNAFTDNIRGKFTKSDLSGLSLGVTMPLTAVTTESGCGAPTTITSPSMDASDIKLTEVRRTATTVTYRAVEWFGLYSTTSEWDSISGEVVLTRTS